VLRDIIASGVAPVITLDEVFRQSQASAIVLGAHAINAGRAPRFPPGDAGDLFFVDREDPDRALETVLELATRRIPRRFGLDSRRDVQVLAPMQRGSLGVANLNRRLQEILTPSGPGIARSGAELRTGDRVMQTRNDYDRGVFNGDVGLVERVDPVARELSVRFDERLVQYDWTDLDDLSLAWACSIHKSQGSEYPGVVVVLHTQHYVLLQRTLLYTAVTRARRVAVIVGSRRALGIAIRNAATRERCTLLAARLREQAATR
jgi:exodeoxyribonuclease V alpha subunit